MADNGILTMIIVAWGLGLILFAQLIEINNKLDEILGGDSKPSQTCVEEWIEGLYKTSVCEEN